MATKTKIYRRSSSDCKNGRMSLLAAAVSAFSALSNTTRQRIVHATLRDNMKATKKSPSLAVSADNLREAISHNGQSHAKHSRGARP